MKRLTRIKRLVLPYVYDLELMTLLVILFALFILQARYLGQAAFTVSDEGVHALVGKLMWEGQSLYRDFSYSHPPLLSFFLGLSQQFTPSMLPPRLVYLFVNLSSAVALFVLLRRMNGNAVAALVAALFYVSYHQMVDHNFRFMALRQVANVLLIWFLYVSTKPKQTPRTMVMQAALAIASTLVMFQAAANIALVSLAVIFSAPRKQWLPLFKRLSIVGLVTAGALVAFFALTPGSIDATLLDHAARPLVGRLGRITWTMDWGKKDLFFYAFSMASLLFGAVFLPKIRVYCIAALGIIALVFAPRAFFPHYFDIAGPAFAIGVFAGVSLITAVIGKRLRLLVPVIALVLLAVQWTIALPPMLREWKDNKSPEYHGIIQTLKTMPEPLLTFFEPIYAVESGLTTVRSFKLSDFRTFGSLLGEQLSEEEYDRLAAKACTILLVPWDTGYVPKHVQDKWLTQYERIETPQWAVLLRTHNEGCL